MTTFTATDVRASELARCARMAAYRARGAEQQEYDTQTRRYFDRGHLYTEYVLRQLRQKHGADNVEEQVEIPWPLGVGHADAYVKPAKLLVEIKSTVSPSPSSVMFEMAVQQLRIYLRFHPEAEIGALMLLNPSDLRAEDVYKVVLTDEDVAAIDEAVAALRAAIDGGDLPPRVCARPGQARGRLCPFAETCFEGWVPNDPAVIPDPAALDAVTRLASVKNQERDHRTALRALEAARKDVQVELAEVLPVGDSVVGPYVVKRVHKVRRPTFNEKVAEAAGFPVESLAEFYTGGSSWDEFRVERAQEPGAIDYDESGVPF